MTVFPDFYEKILSAFEKHQLRYLVIGGFAANFHGVIRSTLDLDIWVDKKHDNLENLFKAFVYLGYSQNNCHQAVEAFSNDHIIKIPFEDNLIEIMDDFITKMNFDKVYMNRNENRVNDFTFSVIGIDDLIAMKSKTNRYRDLLDVKELKEIKNDNSS
jgi:hypothetical protein